MTADGATRREETPAAPNGATRRESAPAAVDGATRREGSLPDGATRRETPPAASTATWRRTNLPDPLAPRYQVLRELESTGAQADLLVCTELATDKEVVIKLYRRGITVDEATIQRLQASLQQPAAQDHLVPMTFDSWLGVSWEIQEYFPVGSLADYLSPRRRVPDAAAREILAELSQALAYLHGLDIVHRDLKPQNVLIRALEPLDLVLADFGLSSALEMSFDVRSLAGSFPYLAPEAISANRVSKAGDWWSLGVIMYEALHGRHLFTDRASQLPLADALIKNQLAEGTYTLEPTGDDHWDWLIAGLLTRDLAHRWGAGEVTSWLAGGSPEVFVEARTTHVTRAFPFVDSQYRDPVELVAAFRRQPTRAGNLLSSPAQKADLRTWLQHSTVGDRADHVLSDGPGFSPDRALVRLQAIIDPVSPVWFGGRELADEQLNAVLSAALAGDRDAIDWLTALRTKMILSAWASEADVPEAVRLADERLSSWWGDVEQQLAKVPAEQSLAAGVRDGLEPMLFAAALDPAERNRIVELGRRALHQTESDRPGWAEPIAAGLAGHIDDPGRAAVAATLLPLAQQQERTRLAEIAAVERDRRRREAAGRRQERMRTARRRVGTSFRGSLLLCTIGAVLSVIGLVQFSGRDLQSAIITAAVTWLVVALGWSARELVSPATTARLGNMLFILALAWGIKTTAVALAIGAVPASTWQLLPVAAIAGAWAMRLVNLAIDAGLRDRAAGGVPPADWLGGPASVFGGLALALEAAKQVNQVATAWAGGTLTSSALGSAPTWAIDALDRAAAVVGPLVAALPAPLIVAVPPLATATALMLLVGSGDVRRWRPAALTTLRAAVIVLGLLTAAIWIYSLGAVLLMLGYLLIAIVVVVIIVWIIGIVLGG